MLVTIDVVEAEAAAVAQEVAVHVCVVAVVHALQQAVALARADVAAHGAAVAHGRCRLQVPLAGVGLRERLVGEHAGGAHLDEVAGEHVLQHAFFRAAEVRAIARAEGLQVGAAGVVTIEAHAPVAGDAAVHLVVEQRAQVLVAEGALLRVVVTHGVARHHRHVLQVALAAFLAHRAVVRVVAHQVLDHARAEVHAGLRADRDAHVVCHLRHARHRQATLGVVLVAVHHHRALAARTQRAELRVPAEVRQVETRGQHGMQEVRARLHLDHLPVYVQLDHAFVSDPVCLLRCPLPFGLLPATCCELPFRLPSLRCSRWLRLPSPCRNAAGSSLSRCAPRTRGGNTSVRSTAARWRRWRAGRTCCPGCR